MDDRSPPTQKTQAPYVVAFDAILPADMAARAEESGVKKAGLDPLNVLILSVLGGAFIAFGAVFATTITAGSASVVSATGDPTFSAGLPFGLIRLLTGMVFTLGIVMVVVAGAELFTGNNLIVMAWASGRVTTRAVLFNWTIVFVGNFIGAIMTAVLVFYSTQYTFGGGSVGLNALNIANTKLGVAFVPAFILGILCNALVCLGIWMCYGARTTIDRVVTLVPPIAAFAASGFEHCIANIYFIPMALFIKAGAPDSFWASIRRTPADYPALTWDNFLIGNLLPVTVGNIIGGAVMVAAVYWFVYLRKKPAI